jgi:hypothetical protein
MASPAPPERTALGAAPSVWVCRRGRWGYWADPLAGSMFWLMWKTLSGS